MRPLVSPQVTSVLAKSSMTVALTVLIIFCLAALITYFSPWFWRQRKTRAIRRSVRENRLLALTYDDGPSERMTPRILDVLKREGVTATFFLLGRNASQHPDLVDRIVHEGHEVGCHSDQHLNAWKVLPASANRDIDQGYSRLERWIRPDGIFRPPFGKMTLATFLSLRQRRATTWWWTIDSGDTHIELPKPRTVVERVQKDGGGIVLMHDLDRTADRDDFVLETTISLLNLAKVEQLSVVTLSRLDQ